MDPDAVVERVRAGGLLERGAAVVVLLSGGRDSVCLLDVAVRIAGAACVGAVHVDYGLREESAADADHCRALCAELGVALTVERAMPRGGGNMQAWARELRYAAAARAASRRGPATAIAVGHTADDQVETILYRLASSPSRRALLGMRAREGAVVRPLLELTRAQTTAYCQARGLSWRDDATNDGRDYARNRIRHDLLTALRAVHPAAEANVLRVAAVLGEEAELLDALVDEQFDAPAEGLPAGAPGGRTIPLERLRALAPALRRLVVQRLADEAAGRPVPGAAGRADAVAALRDRGTAYAELGGGVRAVAEYGVVRVEAVARGARGEALADADAAPDAVELPIPGAVAFGAWRIACEASDPEPREGVLDRAALGDGPLLVRPWRSGDRIAPVGLGGSKSLQDLFTARRIPRARRGALPVVVAGEEIAWVPGVATAARFGISARTREAVRLSATPAP